MKKGTILFVLSLFLCVGLLADSRYQYIHSWDTDIYFGYVIYPEAKHDGKDALVLREGHSTPDVADLNLPIAPGDKIITGERRCEIQFDTGTIIRLDRNSELKIETILAQSLSSRNALTNLLLFRGQAYVMYKRYIRKELFQIITPNVAVKLAHKSVAMINVKSDGDTDVFVKQGRARMLYGPNENAIKSDVVKKSGMITITAKHEMIDSPYEMAEDFEGWNTKINEEFMDLHEGKSVVPLPIQKLPESVYYFAQKYGSLYGEWLWDRYYGYVWRPFLNDYSYPSGGRWMPYHHGRWTSVQGQLFWVPAEKWGWVPYHLGIWVWNKSKGWVWIPGSVFAPAWVDWAYIGGYFCWRPWSVLDWYGYAVYRDGYFPYFAHMIHPADDPFLLGDTSRGSGIDTAPAPGIYSSRKVLSKDQLKAKKTAPFPMPDEWKNAYKKAITGLKNGDEGILVPLKETPNHLAVVNQEDLNSSRIHEKIVKLTSISEAKNVDSLSQRNRPDPHRKARQTFARNEKIASLREKVTVLIIDLKGMKSLEMQDFQTSRVIVEPSFEKKQARESKERAMQSGHSGVKTTLTGSQGTAFYSLNSHGLRSSRSPSRFRDWNPDVKAAHRSGVSIRYSSRSNEVRCPELNISSRHVVGSRGYEGPRVHLTSRGSLTSSGSSSGSGAAFYGGGGSSGSGASSGSSSASSTNSGSKNASSGGGKGGVVKK
jgi:hypothetical protein